MTAESGSHLLANLVSFGRLLRRAGLGVHVGRMLDVAEALQHVDMRVRDDVYHACRTLLVHRREDLALFETLFFAFWRDHAAQSSPRAEVPSARSRRTREGPGDSVAEPAGGSGLLAANDGSEHRAATDSPGHLRTWSDVSALANKDFAEFTTEEMAFARAALERLVWTPGERRTRRWVSGAGRRVDLRRALARSLRTGGDVVRLPRRRRRTRPRSVVLLCDVSGSMDRSSRMLLHFAHAVSRRHRRVEAFLFSTGLTRITRQLRERKLNDALEAVTRAAPGWSGGTRIGASIKELHQQWSRRVLRGGPVVLLVSDGWDCGDPLLLRDQIARLKRSCHRLVWLNPLIGTAGYAPLTRGLQAALPFVDDFLPARTLANLADLAAELNTLATNVRGKG